MKGWLFSELRPKHSSSNSVTLSPTSAELQFGSTPHGAIPTDRGIVFIRFHPDGTKSALVCCGVVDGLPIHGFAIHRRRLSVHIDPAIEWERIDESSQHTKRIVLVSATRDGGVSIQLPSIDPGPLMAMMAD